MWFIVAVPPEPVLTIASAYTPPLGTCTPNFFCVFILATKELESGKSPSAPDIFK